jgi:asparagine synthase (glutamine-hydrolysing)|tara:strand:- start:72 stop:1025 length:954 start_codon:yes stop_codon:yes gene_type:complete
MTEEETQIYAILDEVISQCEADWISLSGGLDSSIIGHFIKDRSPKAIVVITEDFIASDLSYSQIVSKHLGIPLEIHNVRTEQILDGIENTIKILKNFNDIEIRNSVVMYMSLDALNKKGVKSVLTGDGADEIFAGYNFLLKKSKTELTDELKRIKKIMHFSSQEIAKNFGIKIESPFLDDRVMEFAQSIPLSMKIKQKNQKVFGKYILRKTFEDYLPTSIVWREKSPMQEGAGTSGLTNLFETIITDAAFSEKTKEIKEKDNVTIRSKESLQYYQIFKENFDLSKESDSNKKLCPDCTSEIDENSKFCRMCGKFPID